MKSPMRALAWYTAIVSGFCIIFLAGQIIDGAAEATLNLFVIAAYVPILWFACKFLNQ